MVIFGESSQLAQLLFRRGAEVLRRAAKVTQWALCKIDFLRSFVEFSWRLLEEVTKKKRTAKTSESVNPVTCGCGIN